MIGLGIIIIGLGVFLVATPAKAPSTVTPATADYTYSNASADNIVVDTPKPGDVVSKEFSVLGKAKGWYFEASFPVRVLDKDGNVLFEGPAQAQGDWMTSEFVPFLISVKITSAYKGPATLVLHNDNPSGMPENDASVSLPITIKY